MMGKEEEERRKEMWNSVMDYTNNIYLRVWDRGMIFEDLVE